MGEVQRQQRTAQWSFTHCQTFSGCDTSVSASVAIPTNTLITLDGDTVAEFQSAGAVVFAGIGVRLASTIAPTGEIEFGFVGAEGFASLTGFGGSAPFGAFDIVNEINKTETASLTNCPP